MAGNTNTNTDTTRAPPPATPENNVQNSDTPLSSRQEAIVNNKLQRFKTYLQTKGKDPYRQIAYADKSIPIIVSRIKRLQNWVWTHIEPTTELTPQHADQIIGALATDQFHRKDDTPYSEDSKRKFKDALTTWFTYQNVDWETDVTFTASEPQNQADPFTKDELRLLWEAALDYKSIPTYNNLTPSQRDRWKRYLAQHLGKPKTEISPADWDKHNNRWDIPALIRTTREAGWRPDLISRMPTQWYAPTDQTIHIPAGKAPKNDAVWHQPLSDEAAFALEQWLDQRPTMDRYDDSDLIWLNREGNPYNSATLNNLLRNLMDAADIQPNGRKLVWYSFRHSIGTIVYEEYKSLKPVAEALRQKSRDAAARYVHPTQTQKRDVAELL